MLIIYHCPHVNHLLTHEHSPPTAVGFQLPCMSSRSKNSHLELRLNPQCCTGCPIAHSRCLCIKLHVLFRQPKKLSSVQKPLVLSACRTLQRLSRRWLWGRDTRLQLVNNPMVPFWFFSLLSAHFHLCRGSAFELASTTSPSPLLLFPLFLSLVQQLVLHWFTGVDTSSVFEL